MATVIFIFEGRNTTIQCLKEDKFETICQKFGYKEKVDLNSLFFMYNGSQITNLKLTFKQQANSLDKDRNIMNIIVVRIEQDKIKCPKLGELFNFKKELLDNLTLSNNNLNDILIGLQMQIDNIINSEKIITNLNMLNIQLKIY